MTQITEVDSDDLDEQERQEFTNLVSGADAGSLLPQATPAPGRTDRFQYDLSIDIAGKHYDLSYGEDRLPGQLRPLVDRMVEIARRRPEK